MPTVPFAVARRHVREERRRRDSSSNSTGENRNEFQHRAAERVDAVARLREARRGEMRRFPPSTGAGRFNVGERTRSSRLFAVVLRDQQGDRGDDRTVRQERTEAELDVKAE